VAAGGEIRASHAAHGPGGASTGAFKGIGATSANTSFGPGIQYARAAPGAATTVRIFANDPQLVFSLSAPSTIFSICRYLEDMDAHQKVYAYAVSLFDPNCSGHLETMHNMAPRHRSVLKSLMHKVLLFLSPKISLALFESLVPWGFAQQLGQELPQLQEPQPMPGPMLGDFDDSGNGVVV